MLSNSDLFRQAWGSFATGVSLITTVEEDGSVHGMTANGIASVSLDPTLAMVCVGHSAKTFPILRASGKFGINILTEDQKAIGEYYAKSDKIKQVFLSRVRNVNGLTREEFDSMPARELQEMIIDPVLIKFVFENREFSLEQMVTIVKRVKAWGRK